MRKLIAAVKAIHVKIRFPECKFSTLYKAQLSKTSIKGH